MASFKVSIIVNNFNYDRFLAAAIDSALAQTYPHCEVIVVDDGSTDKSREILRGYVDRATVLLQENAGQAAAFNAGFEKSSGDLVLFLDSDDALRPEAISELVANWNESFTKLQFPLEIVDGSGTALGLSMPSNHLSHGDLVHSLLTVGRYVTSPTSGNLFSRRFLNEIMPMPVAEWTQGADSYLNVLAAFNGPIGAVHRHLGCYRVHGESMTTIVFRQKINIGQIERLIQHGERQQYLVNSIAQAKGLQVKPFGLKRHWLQLKLTLTYQKLGPKVPHRFAALFITVCRFVKSAAKDNEVGISRKIQLSAWAILSAILPKSSAEKVILYGFDLAPKSRLKHLLRRSWNRDRTTLVPVGRKGI